MTKRQRWLICGGRGFRDYKFLVDFMDNLVKGRGTPELVITGGQRTRVQGPIAAKLGSFIGADYFGEEWAKFNGIKLEVYPANWNGLGNSAGIERNGVMLLAARPNLVVAFPGDRGTRDMTERARRAKIEVLQALKD